MVGWATVGIGLLSGKFRAISTLGLSAAAVYGLGFLAIFLVAVLMNVFPSQEALVVNSLLGGIGGTAFATIIWRFFVSSKV